MRRAPSEQVGSERVGNRARVTRFIVIFFADGQLTSTKLNDLYKRLDDIKNVTREIANLTSATTKVVEGAEGNLTEAESVVENARQTLLVRGFGGNSVHVSAVSKISPACLILLVECRGVLVD